MKFNICITKYSNPKLMISDINPLFDQSNGSYINETEGACGLTSDFFTLQNSTGNSNKLYNQIYINPTKTGFKKHHEEEPTCYIAG